jgi:hypothetical protein
MKSSSAIETKREVPREGDGLFGSRQSCPKEMIVGRSTSVA